MVRMDSKTRFKLMNLTMTLTTYITGTGLKLNPQKNGKCGNLLYFSVIMVILR